MSHGAQQQVAVEPAPNNEPVLEKGGCMPAESIHAEPLSAPSSPEELADTASLLDNDIENADDDSNGAAASSSDKDGDDEFEIIDVETGSSPKRRRRLQEPIAVAISDHRRLPSVPEQASPSPVAPSGLPRAPLSPPACAKPTGVAVLAAVDLIRRQAGFLSDISDILSLPLEAAALLARHFKWSRESLLDRFWEDPDAVLSRVGARHFVPAADSCHSTAQPQAGTMYTCCVCFEQVDGADFVSANCEHFFCSSCFSRYLSVAVDDGVACIHTKCMHPGCSAAVPESVFRRVLPKQAVAKYQKHQLKNFVDADPHIRWCPSPSCDNILYSESTGNREGRCSCGQTLCLGCGQIAHRPASCECFRSWLSLDRTDGQSSAWLSSHTKDCPFCRSRIFKDGGCQHVSCAVCKRHFCWMCLGDWSQHGSQTGGFYNCNRYNSVNAEAAASADWRRMNKYSHCYRKYVALGEQLEKADGDLRETVAKVVAAAGDEDLDVGFVEEAVSSVVLWRKHLKFSFVAVYFLREPSPSRTLFEYWQKQLEDCCENLAGLMGREETAAGLAALKGRILELMRSGALLDRNISSLLDADDTEYDPQLFIGAWPRSAGPS